MYLFHKHNKIRAVILMMALFFSVKLVAQNDRLGTWNIVNVQYNFNKKVNAFIENQFRSQKLFEHFSYHELKAGVGFNVSDKLSILLGNGFYQTYSIGGNFKSPVTTSEYRMWEQLTITNNISRFKVEHRYRAEQRWLPQGFRNRFRYRLNTLLPLNKPSMAKGVLYAAVFDEIFLTDKSPYFQRNRFFAGLGYQFSKQLILQSGYIRQFDYNLSNSSAKSYLQTSLLFNIHSGRSDREYHPGAMD